MHIVLVVGYPGAGKTTTVRKLLDYIPSAIGHRRGNAAWVGNEHTVVFGRWSGFHKDTSIAGRLDGTDRMHSCAFQQCVDLLSEFVVMGIKCVVAEGFLLCKDSFIRAGERCNALIHIFELETSRDESMRRMIDREPGDRACSVLRKYDMWDRRRLLLENDARWQRATSDTIVEKVRAMIDYNNPTSYNDDSHSTHDVPHGLVETLRTMPGYQRRNSKIMRNKTIVLGFTRSIVYGPSVSQATRQNSETVATLLALLRNHAPDFKVSSILINCNFCRLLHTDKGNLGETHMLTVGDFTGGDLWIYPGRVEPTRGRWVTFDGRLPHCTFPYHGERYSIVFFASRYALRVPSHVLLELSQYGFDTDSFPATDDVGTATLSDAVPLLPTTLVDCVPEHLLEAHRNKEFSPDPSVLPIPSWGQRDDRSVNTTRHAHKPKTTMQRGDTVRAAQSTRAPRTHKTCDRPAHEGERCMPLTTEFFYIYANNKGYVCRQCKKREVYRPRVSAAAAAPAPAPAPTA